MPLYFSNLASKQPVKFPSRPIVSAMKASQDCFFAEGDSEPQKVEESGRRPKILWAEGRGLTLSQEAEAARIAQNTQHEPLLRKIINAFGDTPYNDVSAKVLECTKQREVP